MPGENIRFRESVIRHAYRGALECGARLFAFADSSPTGGNTEIDEEQTILAIDDLMRFAIYMRRLLVLTDTVNSSKNTIMALERIEINNGDLFFKKHINSTTFWKLLSTIIHHEYIEIYRRENELLFDISKEPKDKKINIFLSRKDSFILPKIIVLSDRDYAFIGIKYIMEKFAVILEHIVDACSSEKIYLERD